MAGSLLLALAQLNPVMGDITGNSNRLRRARAEAAGRGASLIITSELFLCGYPPEDLALKPSFQKTLRHAVEDLACETADGGPGIIVGSPWVEDGKLYNAALLLEGGEMAGRVFKRDLPNYGPFDEKRIFTAGPLPQPLDFRGRRLGLLVCEDMWTPEAAACLAQKGAEILLVPNGSPYETGKQAQREDIARQRVTETGLPLAYVNQVGGQDELVFDGASFVLDKTGACVLRAKAWDEDLAFLFPSYLSRNSGNFEGKHTVSPPSVPPASGREENIYSALMLGLKDYVGKNGFPGVVLGLSGGIDSALVAALAVDALGPDKVHCVMMPSPYTSQDSCEDAEALARNLGCRYDVLPIAAAMQAFATTLAPAFAGKEPDVTEENIQARCRGMLLMALSNKFGLMVISTGNKSEMSVGYSTLYGDLCGGFAVLKDVYKTEIYKIARWRNARKPASALGPDGAIIPERIFTKAPTAELRPDQKDQDSLPPYDILDGILQGLIENDMGVQQVAEAGFDPALVRRVWTMLDRAEYKRRQAPPGVKITRRALSRDRRYPITNRYRES